MIDFEYAAAATVDEAVSLLAARGDRARLLAGGTDLLVQLREGLRGADLIVDVKKIPELMELKFDPKTGLRIGAAAPVYRLYENAEVVGQYAAICDAARIIGGWQIQSRASVGGNLCNASPAADSTPALMAHRASCQIAGPKGRRTVAIDEFFAGPGKNVLARGELLVSIDAPTPGPREGSAYQRFIPRNEMDIAVVGVGASLRLDDSGGKIVAARIGLGAVAPTALLAVEACEWLVDKPANDASFQQAGELAKKIASPISDKRGAADYRLHLIGVLVKRTLAAAAERARRSH